MGLAVHLCRPRVAMSCWIFPSYSLSLTVPMECPPQPELVAGRDFFMAGSARSTSQAVSLAISLSVFVRLHRPVACTRN